MDWDGTDLIITDRAERITREWHELEWIQADWTELEWIGLEWDGLEWDGMDCGEMAIIGLGWI